MKAEDIVEGLNRHIKDSRSKMNISSKGHLVLQRVVEPHPIFKVYRIYKAVLWFVKGKDKYIVISLKYSANMLDDWEKSAIREVNTELCHLIFNWVGSDSYRHVIQGDYETAKV